MPFQLNQLTSAQLDELPREKTVFFFSIGPIEDHGPHLPLGLDIEESTRLSCLAAQRLENEKPGWYGILLPAIPLGVDSNTTRVAMTVRPYVIRDYLVDVCQSFIKQGFFHFVCFSGHLGPRQLTAVEEAGILIRKSARLKRLGSFAIGRFQNTTPTLVSASSSLVQNEEVRRSPLWPDPKEHAGARDTSMALVVTPDLVKPSYQSLPPLARPQSKWLRDLERRSGRVQGYWGNPAEATLEKGEAQLKEALDRVFPKLNAVWGGANPRNTFRSWYGVFPPNKSFFKAWILALLFFTFICLWLAMSLQGLNLD